MIGVFQNEADASRSKGWRRRSTDRWVAVWRAKGRGNGIPPVSADGMITGRVCGGRTAAALASIPERRSAGIASHLTCRRGADAERGRDRRDAGVARRRNADIVRIEARLESGGDPALDIVVVRRIDDAGGEMVGPLVATRVRDLASLIAAGAVRLQFSAGDAA